jgi:acetoin utilization protein AcuB
VRVREVMRPAPVTVRPDTSLRATAALMEAHGLRQVAVTDDGGRLVGILTDRDLRRGALLPALARYVPWEERRLLAPRVRDVMTWAVTTIESDADLARAGFLMFERRVGTLPVLEDGRLVGLLAEEDLLEALRKQSGERCPPELYPG